MKRRLLPLLLLCLWAGAGLAQEQVDRTPGDGSDDVSGEASSDETVPEQVVPPPVMAGDVSPDQASPAVELEELEVAPKPSAPQPSGPIVRGIAVEGNRRIETAAILARIGTTVGTPLDRRRLSDDLKAVYELGYFEEVEVLDRGRDGDADLILRVVEKRSIKTVTFRGNEEIKAEDLTSAIGTQKFGLLDQHTLAEDVGKILQKYTDKGYFLVRVKPEIADLPENQAEVVFVIEENQPLVIRRINFVGNHFYTEDELRGWIETKEGGIMALFQGMGSSVGSYKQELFEIDKQRLLYQYLRKGFVNVKVAEPEVAIAPDRKGLYLTIRLEEGEQYTVTSIDFSGDLIRDKDEFHALLQSRTDELFNYEVIQKDLQRISLVYQDEGYAFPNIIPRTHTNDEQHTLRLDFQVQKGLKTTVERIDILGNHSTRDKIIRRQILIAEGELYHASKLKESEFNLRSLGFFKEVKITHKTGSAEDRLILLVEVTEENTGTFTVGAAFNTLENFQFIAQIQKANLLGYGWTINLSARMGGRSKLFQVNFVEPYLLDSEVQLSLDAFNQENRFNDFSTLRQGGGATLGYPIYRPYYRVSGGYNLENVELSNLTDFQKNLFKDGLTSAVVLSVWRDSRIRISMFQTLSGTFTSASTRYAGTFLGGDHSFVEYTLKHLHHYPVYDGDLPLIGGSQIELRSRLRYLASVNGKPVPLHERYFPGGINSMRGFDFRSLGPAIYVASGADPNSFVRKKFRIGGNKEFVLNLEYIMPLFREQNILWVTFFDLGNAFNNDEPINPLELRPATGVGLRWYSPIGPLRFEWGFPLDRRDDERSMVFEFSIGTPF